MIHATEKQSYYNDHISKRTGAMRLILESKERYWSPLKHFQQFHQKVLYLTLSKTESIYYCLEYRQNNNQTLNWQQ